MAVADRLVVPNETPSHWLHAPARVWAESNCYADLWIEVEHALGLDPVAGLAYTLSAYFGAEQWTFVKPFASDLELLYGLDVREINPWRRLEEHVVEEIGLGNLLTIEVDSFYLPDTAGVSHGLEHVKTTIVPAAIDPMERSLRYFHGMGCHVVSGDDYAGIFGSEDAAHLPPYVELIRRSAPPPEGDELVALVVRTAREHLGRRPSINPVSAMAADIRARLPSLAAADADFFHRYAFVTCRQCGATAELAADFVDWLSVRGHRDLAEAASSFRTVAERAKALQFALARVARGRRADLEPSLEVMADAWHDATRVMSRGLRA